MISTKDTEDERDGRSDRADKSQNTDDSVTEFWTRAKRQDDLKPGVHRADAKRHHSAGIVNPGHRVNLSTKSQHSIVTMTYLHSCDQKTGQQMAM